MSFRNYHYDLSNGQLYSYQQSRQAGAGSGESAGSMSSACSFGSAGSTDSAGSTNVWDTVYTGSTGSIGSTAKVGSVGCLSFNTIVILFENGNLTVEEFFSGLEANSCTKISQKTQNNRYVVSFVYNKKKYTISCSRKLHLVRKKIILITIHLIYQMNR